MKRLSIRSIALLLMLAGAVLLAPSAFAEEGEGEGPGNDLKKKIQAKMEKILKLMRDNEAALLKLSSGKAAATRKVDVEVPEGQPQGGADKNGEAKKGGEGAEGENAAKEIEKLLESVSKKGGSIPDELKQLVEMIPL